MALAIELVMESKLPLRLESVAVEWSMSGTEGDFLSVEWRPAMKASLAASIMTLARKCFIKLTCSSRVRSALLTFSWKPTTQDESDSAVR